MATAIEFKRLFRADMQKYMRDGKNKAPLYLRVWHFLYRKAQTRKNPFIKVLYKELFRIYSKRHGIEIPTCCKIGRGLYIGHPYNITVNGGAILGENCNIHKGVTIGAECRGKREGVPTIGNKVSFCVNATVVGRITVGDDVIIAPNSWVNCDVPSHSIVIGNPCIIKHRDHATEGYIPELF